MRLKKSAIDWADVMQRLSVPLQTNPVNEACSLGETYLFSEQARRALFYAKHNASLRNTDSVTHHITMADIEHGVQRERHKK